MSIEQYPRPKPLNQRLRMGHCNHFDHSRLELNLTGSHLILTLKCLPTLSSFVMIQSILGSVDQGLTFLAPHRFDQPLGKLSCYD